ncbi:alpha/beta hydrolase [Sphingomonas sp. M1-B02]|uniref:alpha/beta hydrolase n=1 Tax=Sphingomonas sp. M1-B02 TaxID=3114300 RepID=UPI00223F264B|nr:alpha/beta hydrolase [Sphingomonas sp. S6-11]UZK67235.1 alpha/beta hydrolase [Sphingomonas sp. S6-11]
MLNADTAWPLWEDAPLDGAFTLQDPEAASDAAIVTAVDRPWLFGFAPARPSGRAMLVLGGGGYTQLMAGREGVAVARWLTGLGYHAYVLIHRFPTAAHGIAAPLDDAREAMRMIRAGGFEHAGVVGLSSGGHLAACLAADYPADWPPPATRHAGQPTRPDALIIGYAPISTNAKGRTIVADKPPLPPPEKQAMYDRLQPDAQLSPSPPPAFLVYSGNDPVVPVENGRRLHAALEAAGAGAELHIFADAPHGFALDTPDLPVSIWPRLCEAWLRQIGFL